MLRQGKKKTEPHYSPIKFIKQAQTTLKQVHPSPLFVPFAHQRDSLGRLIKPQKQEELQKHIIVKRPQESYDHINNKYTSQTCISLSEKANLIQDTITNSFQYKDPCPFKLYQSNKIQIHKKTSIQIPSIKSNKKYSGEDSFNESPVHQKNQSPRPRFLSSDLTLQVRSESNLLQRYQSLPKLKQSSSNYVGQETNRKKTMEEKAEDSTKRKLSFSNSKNQKTDPIAKKNCDIPKQRIQLQLVKRQQSKVSPRQVKRQQASKATKDGLN